MDTVNGWFGGAKPKAKPTEQEKPIFNPNTATPPVEQPVTVNELTPSDVPSTPLESAVAAASAPTPAPVVEAKSAFAETKPAEPTVAPTPMSEAKPEVKTEAVPEIHPVGALVSTPSAPSTASTTSTSSGQASSGPASSDQSKLTSTPVPSISVPADDDQPSLAPTLEEKLSETENKG